MTGLVMIGILTIYPLVGWEPQEVRVDVRSRGKAKVGEWVCVDIVSDGAEHRSCWQQTPLTRIVESRRYVLGVGEYKAKVLVNWGTVEGEQGIRIIEAGRCMDPLTGESRC